MPRKLDANIIWAKWFKLKCSAGTALYICGNWEFIKNKLKSFKISCNDTARVCYTKVGILSSPNYNEWVINVSLIKETNIDKFISLYHETNVKYAEKYKEKIRAKCSEKPKPKEEMKEVKEVTIPSKLNTSTKSFEEECKEYLESRGYFVYLPSKGDKITIINTKEFEFQLWYRM